VSELVICRSMPDTAMEPVGDGWTVGGIAMPYGREQVVSDDRGVTSYVEEIAYGAFERDCRGHPFGWVQLRHGHGEVDRDRFLGRCVHLAERDEGLWAEFKLNRDHPLAEEARSGDLVGWSVSATVRKTREVRRGGRVVTVREQCQLHHIAATASPQYAGAGVLVSREHVLIPADPTPRLDAVRARWAEKGYRLTRTS
jgi:HK97 family phage prohead protease